MSDEFPMTVHGKKTLDEELENLIKVEREKTKNQISEARAHGDLKENADYHAAKEKQSQIEGRILEIQGKLARVRVVDPTQIKSETIVFGATVTFLDVEKDEEHTYQLVGEDESDLKKNKISFNSPLGSSMIGKEEGDTITVHAPKGEREYEIINVEYK